MISAIQETLFIINKSLVKILLMSLMFVMSAFFEIIAILFFSKFISLLLDANNNDINLFQKFFFVNNDNVYIYTGLIVLFVFIIKLLINFIVQRKIFSFSFLITSELIKKLFDLYTNQYSKVNYNLSSSIQNITNHTYVFINQGLISILKLFSEILFLIMIVSFLIYINTYLSILFFIIILVTFLLFGVFTSSKLKKYADQINQNQKKIFNIVQDGILGKDELKVNNLTNFFRGNLTKYVEKYRVNIFKFNVLDILPRIVFELVIISTVLLYIMITTHESNSAEIIESVVLFGVSAARIIPSISQISIHINNIKFSQISRLEIHNLFRSDVEYTYKNKPNSYSLDNETRSLNSFALINICYSHYGSSNNFLENINLENSKGNILGIAGASGSGKSTLIKIILGIFEKKCGDIVVDGKKVDQVFLMSNVSYVPQSTYIFSNTIKFNICLENKFDENKFNKVLSMSNIDFLDSRLYEHVTNEMPNLSGGQIQRVGLARALYSGKDIIVLDEPSSSLDFKNEEYLRRSLMNIKKDKIVFLVSHSGNLLSVCDSIYEI